MTFLDEAAGELRRIRDAIDARAARIPGLREEKRFKLADEEERNVFAERKWISGCLIALAAIEAGLPPCFPPAWPGAGTGKGGVGDDR